jgi:uncharacterized membrane protein YhiD involved in acid resistance
LGLGSGVSPKRTGYMMVSLVGRMAIGSLSSPSPDLVTHATSAAKPWSGLGIRVGSGSGFGFRVRVQGSGSGFGLRARVKVEG